MKSSNAESRGETKSFLDKAIEILDFKLIWPNGASIHISEVIICFFRKQKGQFTFHNGAETYHFSMVKQWRTRLSVRNSVNV